MTDARHRGLWHRTGLIGGVGAMLLIVVAAEGCSDETGTSTSAATSSSSGAGGNGGTGGTGGNGGTDGGVGGEPGIPQPEINEVCKGSASTFHTPFDATPEPEGVNVVFTALDANGDAGVFRGPATGGACNVVQKGPPYVAPFNLVMTADSKTIFVADSGSDDAAESDNGHIFNQSAMGGMPTVFPGTEGRRPRGVDVFKDAEAETLYFTGTDPGTKQRGVFRVLAAGGAVSAVAQGENFKDPSGIVVSSKKVSYVCDTVGADTGLANILAVEDGGAVTTVATNIRAGYPCGVALSVDETLLFVSTLDPATETDRIARILIAGGDLDYLSNGIDMFTEAAGMHRAKTADSFAWADSKAGGMGTVFTLKMK